MKKFVFIFVFAFFALVAKAQFYGAFYQADPDAWFDKEPYFMCMNSFVYNGWGQNIQNISAVINDEEVYFFPYVWVYGSYIVIGKDSGVEFSPGDKVSLYWGTQCIGTWTYYSQTAKHGATRVRGGGKGVSKLLKGAWKYVKRIR